MLDSILTMIVLCVSQYMYKHLVHFMELQCESKGKMYGT